MCTHITRRSCENADSDSAALGLVRDSASPTTATAVLMLGGPQTRIGGAGWGEVGGDERVESSDKAAFGSHRKKFLTL